MFSELKVLIELEQAIISRVFRYRIFSEYLIRYFLSLDTYHSIYKVKESVKRYRSVGSIVQ